MTAQQYASYLRAERDEIERKIDDLQPGEYVDPATEQALIDIERELDRLG